MKPYFENVFMSQDKFKIKSSKTDTVEEIVRVHPHMHQEVEVLYFIKGSAKQQVNDRTFNVSSKDIVIIASNQLHSTYSDIEERCEVLVIQFDIGSFTAEHDKSYHKDMLDIFQNNMVYDNPIKGESPVGSEILECIFKINQELMERKKSYRNMVESFLFKFGVIILRTNLVKKAPSINVLINKDFLEKTFKLIDCSFSKKITLKDAAEASNLSIAHFCRVFKKTTGMTFNNYINFFRVQLSIRMLESSKSLTEISYECGYGSISTFIRSFKKYYKCTPTEYKDKYFVSRI